MSCGLSRAGNEQGVIPPGRRPSRRNNADWNSSHKATHPNRLTCLPPHEKRELFAIHERAREKGYELWDVARLHERQLEQQRVPGIEIGKAVKRCLEDKEAEGVSPRSLQSLRSVLLRFASKHEGRLMDELDAADATTFVDTLGVSLRTRLGYLTDLRTIFSWGVQKGLIEVNPVVAAMPGRATRKRIMLAKRSRRKEQVLSVEECRKADSMDGDERPRPSGLSRALPLCRVAARTGGYRYGLGGCHAGAHHGGCEYCEGCRDPDHRAIDAEPCGMDQGYQGHLQIPVTLKEPQAALGAG